MGNQKINSAGLKIIKDCEGLKLRAYKCPANVLTIGWGHTKNVREGQVITVAQAEELLKEDLAEFEAGVSQAVTVPLTEGQFSALVSFSYNLGLGNLRSSTLLRLVNQKKFYDASEQFRKWNKAGGKILNGLVKRRELERQLFLS